MMDISTFVFLFIHMASLEYENVFVSEDIVCVQPTNKASLPSLSVCIF